MYMNGTNHLRKTKISMRYQKICPICIIPYTYLSKHVRTAHKEFSVPERKHLTKSAQKHVPFNQKVECSETDTVNKSTEDDPLMEIARWLYYMPITMTEILKLRGPLNKKFKKYASQKLFSEEIQSVLQSIHRRMTQ